MASGIVPQHRVEITVQCSPVGGKSQLPPPADPNQTARGPNDYQCTTLEAGLQRAPAEITWQASSPDVCRCCPLLRLGLRRRWWADRPGGMARSTDPAHLATGHSPTAQDSRSRPGPKCRSSMARSTSGVGIFCRAAKISPRPIARTGRARTSGDAVLSGKASTPRDSRPRTTSSMMRADAGQRHKALGRCLQAA